MPHSLIPLQTSPCITIPTANGWAISLVFAAIYKALCLFFMAFISDFLHQLLTSYFNTLPSLKQKNLISYFQIKINLLNMNLLNYSPSLFYLIRLVFNKKNSPSPPFFFVLLITFLPSWTIFFSLTITHHNFTFPHWLLHNNI